MNSIDVVRKRKRDITSTVEKSLRKNMGIAWYNNVSVLYCRECIRVIGEIPFDPNRDGWFNPARTCKCGTIPCEDLNMGSLVGVDKGRRILELFGIA